MAFFCTCFGKKSKQTAKPMMARRDTERMDSLVRRPSGGTNRNYMDAAIVQHSDISIEVRAEALGY